MTSRELHWEISGKEVTVRLEQSKDAGTFHIAGQAIPFRLLDGNTLDIDGQHLRFHVLDRKSVV